MASNYYVSRGKKLLREFDKALDQIRGLFLSRYGDESTEVMFREARREYEALIPQLPYIGGRQPFTQFLVATAWYLAMYRVLQHCGETVEEVGILIYQASEAYLQAYPTFLRRILGRGTFSRRYRRRVQKRAAESQVRRYPGDYVYTFVEGDGETFDFGVDYTECAVVKFLAAQGSPELAPHICPVDILYSEALGWGLRRTTTLAEGSARCDFRFKKGGETRVTMPESLVKYIIGVSQHHVRTPACPPRPHCRGVRGAWDRFKSSALDRMIVDNGRRE